MKSAVGRKNKQGTEFEGEYASLLREYVTGGGEAVLGRAYELGRRAISERKSLLELVSLHHQAVGQLFQSSDDKKFQ